MCLPKTPLDPFDDAKWIFLLLSAATAVLELWLNEEGDEVELLPNEVEVRVNGGGEEDEEEAGSEDKSLKRTVIDFWDH